jgi:Anaerobic ribonucleoside-triphosphate reductase
MPDTCIALPVLHALPQPVLDDAERQPCEVWTRVMGYHRPAASFNTGKKGEFEERTYFCEAPDGCHGRNRD